LRYNINVTQFPTDKKQDERLGELRRREEEQLAEVLSQKYGVEYADLTSKSIDTDALRLVSEAQARETEVAAFRRVNKIIFVAMRAPERPDSLKIVSDIERLGYQVRRVMVSRASLEHAWDRYHDISYATETEAGVLTLSNDTIVEMMQKLKKIPDITLEIAGHTSSKDTHRISRVLEILMAGAPPDWQALKSPIEIFPVLGQQLERLLAEVESVATRRVSTYSNIITTAADGVLASLQELTHRLHDLTLKLATFSATALSDLPGIYSTAFLGQGGTTFLLGELSNLLTNKSDDGRPPFDSNEYVIGMVIVAGGPRIPDVQPTYELLKTLFNLPKFDSPLYTILNEIDALVTRTETYAFSADLVPVPVVAAAAAPAPTTFALDGTPITADDPTNPNSGFTNNPDPDFVPC
jgi:hypothetical protein